MGFEYRFVIEAPFDPAEIDQILRAQPTFTDFDPAFGSYDFRAGGTAPAPSMPNAEARIEQDAVYFCIYGDGGTIMDSIQAALAARYRLGSDAVPF